MQSKEYDRIIVIGDIHGCANTVKSLIETKVKPTENDLLIQIGDMVDRGDKVFETVEYMISLDKQFNCIFIKGNHEDMWINYLKHTMRLTEIRTFFYNGGGSTLNSYCEHIIDLNGDQKKPENGLHWNDLPKTHQKFYDNLKIYHEIDDFVFVHAGINPNFPLSDQHDYDMMWIRDTFLYWPKEILKGKIIIHGHTPMSQNDIKKYNIKYKDRINIDSGCVFGECLTCMDVRTKNKFERKCVDRRIA